MRWTLRIFTAAALAVCAAAAYADPPGRVARLNHTSGAVSFAPGEAPDGWVQAVINRPLTGGDRLWADRDGRAEFQLGSTAVRMAPLTSVDVLYLDDDRLQLRLAQGSANLRVRALDADDFVEVATPAGAVIIRQPGSYRISVDPNADATRVSVNFGQAEVITPGPDLTVPSGQAVSISAHAPAAFEIATVQDEFDQWSAERDRRSDRVASTRYVSPNMTGYEDLDHHGSWRTLPEYGNVWVPARVAPGWAPYRHGHWAWISPWGWTWIDDAPWGFAPFHYGRWVHVHDYWAWAPGPIVRRPVYAPALVAFVGGPRWSVSVTSGPAVGWFPLGWREPYQPWYRASARHVHNVNVTHVTNVTNITNVTHIHRNRPEAVTVVSRENFVSARSVERSRVNVAQADLARAEVIRERQPAEPVRASFAQERAGRRPPVQAATREVVAVTQPAAAVRQAPQTEQSAERSRASDDTPRVRVINREEFEARRAERAARREAIAQPAATAPAAAPSGAGATAPRVTATPSGATAPGVTATPAGATAPAATTARPVAVQPGPAPRAAAPAPAAPTAAAAPSAPQARDADREQRDRAERRERMQQAERRAQADDDQRTNARAEQRARFEAEQRARAQAQVQRAPAPAPAPASSAAPPAARERHAQRPQAAAPAAAAPAAAAAQPAPRAQPPARPHRGDDERKGRERRGDSG